MQTLRLMSQNVWDGHKNLPAWEERGMDCSAKVRMQGHVRVLKELSPDVLGYQELNEGMQKRLMFAISDAGLPYAMLWGNQTALLYRADKLEVVDSVYRLYPEEIEGYEGCFNNEKTKGYNVAYFREKATGKCFVYCTTHLWWKHEGDGEWFRQPGSDEARRQQIVMATAKMAEFQEKYGKCPAFIVGDLNCQVGSPALSYALGEGGFTHAHEAAVDYADDGAGYCRCGEKPADKWEDLTWDRALDHILVKDAPEGLVRRFERYTPDYYLLLSDHAPVYIDVAL